MSVVFKFAGNALAFYVIVLLAIYFLQRGLLYFPSSEIYTPAKYGLYDFEEVNMTTSDGVNIFAWYKKASANKPTFVYFHGNGGNLANRVGRFSELAKRGYGLLAVSYRGYGKSGGKPTEQGLYEDGRTAIKFIKGNGIDNIILFGESLGTGVAVQMATEFNDLKGLVLEAPYKSIQEIGQEKYFWLPVKLLIKDKFLSIDKIGSVKTTVLIFHGELDNIVPVSHGKAMYETANEPKKIILYPEYYHFMPDDVVVDEIENYFK